MTQDIVLTTAAATAEDGDTGTVVVNSKITIEGQGHTIRRTPGAPEFRLLRVAPEGDLTVRQTTLRGGLLTNDDGGGLLNEGSVTLEECTVSGNSASNDYGGGVYSRTTGSSQMIVNNSTISGNSATEGGGVESHTSGSSQVTLTNSTVSGNSAFEEGGGVRIGVTGTSQVTLNHSTVSGNSALVGGGVYSVSFATGQVTLQRMLIAGNRAESGAEVFFYSSGGFFNSTFNLFGHSGLTTADALMGVHLGPTDLLATSDSGFAYALPAILNPTLANNRGPTLTHNLVTDSPAIDAGGACDLTTDQRGAPRPQGSACDIGAVEAGENCGNCVDDDGDGLVDFTDPDCTSGTSPITKERAAFTLDFRPSVNATPRGDQLTLTATLAGGSALNPPMDGIGVQFIDEQSRDSLLCVHLPPAVAAPGAWKTKLSETNPRTTWQFKDAPDGSIGDPSKDASTVTYDPIKDTLTVTLTIKETEIGGDTTARNIRTGIGSGMSRWQRIQRWTAKAGGKKLGTP